MKRYSPQLAMLLIGAGFLVALALFPAACSRQPSELIVSGRVEMDDSNIGSKIGGRVLKVYFDEGDEVKAGDVIVQLDDKELQAQMQQAQAALHQAQAQLDLLKAGSRHEDIERAQAVVEARKADLEMRLKGFRVEEVRQAQAELEQAQSKLKLAEKDFQRAQALYKNHTISQQEFDSRRSTYDTAKEVVNAQQQHYDLVKSGSRPEEIESAQAQLAQAQADLERLKNGPRPEEIAAQIAAVEETKANIARIQSQLDETKIVAPADALIETMDLKIGDLVRAGQSVAVLILKRTPYVRCYVPENQMGWVKPNKKVWITVDTYPNRRFHGSVRRINTEAEFTPRNVQTNEKRAELVFETKVDITDAGNDLRPGMFADVHISRD